MKPSRYSTAYQCFLVLLREARQQTGLTQVELAQLLGLPQSYVSKCESGERRLDLLEARAWILALGGSPAAFLEALDEALGRVLIPEIPSPSGRAQSGRSPSTRRSRSRNANGG
jgi:transcriptional regulator with XRE-family HTH domain